MLVLTKMQQMVNILTNFNLGKGEEMASGKAYSKNDSMVVDDDREISELMDTDLGDLDELEAAFGNLNFSEYREFKTDKDKDIVETSYRSPTPVNFSFRKLIAPKRPINDTNRFVPAIKFNESEENELSADNLARKKSVISDENDARFERPTSTFTERLMSDNTPDSIAINCSACHSNEQNNAQSKKRGRG